jgi:hypothetical protein
VDPAPGDGVQRQPNAGGVRDWIPVWQERKKFQRHRKERSLASNQTPPQAASVLISEVRTVHIKAELAIPVQAEHRFRSEAEQFSTDPGIVFDMSPESDLAKVAGHYPVGLRRSGPIVLARQTGLLSAGTVQIVPASNSN